MTWEDRIREAAYTSPTGTRLTFYYEDVSRSVDKRTTAFNFPDADGTYVQDLGRTGRQYPLRLIFWGADCDLQADTFEAALLERGTGKLEHPIYGTVDVVPFGTITREDKLKTAANEAVISVTFWETTGLVYPTAQADPGTAVVAAVGAFNGAAAGEFAEAVDGSTAFKSTYEALLASAKAGLNAIAETTAAVEQQFDAIVASVEQGIDTLVADPLTLAAQTALLIQAPARAAADASARLTAYAALAEAIINGDGADTSETFQTQSLYATAYVTGAIVSAVNNQFETRGQAVQAAEDVLTQFETVAAWRDDKFQALSLIDTGAAYQQLQRAAALTAGFLVFISFSLKQERRLVLDRARTIIDLVAELYGSVDDQLDFFINSNSLTGSEILELPAGREVVYYV